MWLVFSLLTAFFESLKDVFCKISLREADEYVVAWAIRFFSIPFLIPIFFFVDLPELDKQFWPALIIGGILNMIATVFYMKALKSSDLSITVPMVTFTPVFLLITSPLMVGEFPTLSGLAGIILIVVGAYILNIRDSKQGIRAPFKALMAEKGPRFMLVVALIWSITSNIDKIGVTHSSVVFWVTAINVVSAIFLFPVALYRTLNTGAGLYLKNLKTLLVVGFIAALRSMFQITAITLTLVAYVISVKRTSVIFGIFFGYLIFREKGFRERLLGAVVMVAGVFLITL
ncbi:MAG: EamA family transporter [Candidatus Aminicenantes bacterium]|nr:EamA family transporter [Candidatus Aminicenantes bacterium]